MQHYNWIIYVSLLLFIALDAWVQGGITLRNRLYVPMSEQPAINRDLHLLWPWCYVLFVLVCANDIGPDGKLVMQLDIWVYAALLRFALFDSILNRRKGDPLFAVGYTAATDKLLRRIAGTRADLLSAALRLSATAAALVALLLL